MVGAAPAASLELVQESPVRWRLPVRGAMRVPGIVFASRALLPEAAADRSLQQVADVATLPGVVDASYAMPDVHWGYGFPIGGVAATDVAEGGVVSPGGVGFDISCGVRLLLTPLHRADLATALEPLMDALDRRVPRGLGPGGVLHVDTAGLGRILVGGAPAVVADGFGRASDLSRCEDGGVLAGADPHEVGARALERGLGQVGSLGAGNHFLEVQLVDEVVDPAVAGALGLVPGRVCVMIHCGSRGLGHQVCADHVRLMQPAMQRAAIVVPDRQLACAPVDAPEGRAYLGAMAAAANYGRANRQLLTERVREVFADVTGDGDLELVYDVSHNLAKLEHHEVGGRRRLLCVHRKGATRALPPGHPDLPADLSPLGQPVLVPGSMGTASHVLVGVAGGPAFSSCAHGAGRRMSRHAAARGTGAADLRRRLAAAGVVVRARSARGLVEEAPDAYKDVDEVVAVCERAGLGRRVARLVPVGVVKG